MAYFVVLRSGDSALSIPLPDAFPTREAAIAALSAAAGSGSLVLDGEVFIADLSTAVPVLVMQTAPAAAPQAEEAEDVVPLMDAVGAETAYADWTPALVEEDSLAAALKRAATSLEDEGIVAPASVEATPDLETAADDAVEEEEVVEAGESTPSENVDAAVVEEPEAVEAEERSWPWANVEAYTAPIDEAEAIAEPAGEDNAPLGQDDELSVRLAALEEPVGDTADSEPAQDQDFVAEPDAPATVAEPMGVPSDSDSLSEALRALTGAPEPYVQDSPIITSAPAEGEDAYVPRPVILGDYADVAVPADAPSMADADPVATQDTTTVQETPVDAFGFDGGALAADPELAVPEVGYEATGDLDLAGYTCQDCVYSNTCPKVGQSSPKDCGSFQWRSE